MELVHYQQRSVALEFREVKVGRRRHRLIGRHIAGQAAARVRCVVGSAHRQRVPKGVSPGRIGEGLLRLVLQGLPGHNPDDPIGDARADQSAGGDDRQEALSAAGRHGGQHVTHLRLVGGDGPHDPVDQALMATKLLVHRVPRRVAGGDPPPSAFDRPALVLNGSPFRVKVHTTLLSSKVGLPY